MPASAGLYCTRLGDKLSQSSYPLKSTIQNTHTNSTRIHHRPLRTVARNPRIIVSASPKTSNVPGPKTASPGHASHDARHTYRTRARVPPPRVFEYFRTSVPGSRTRPFSTEGYSKPTIGGFRVCICMYSIRRYSTRMQYRITLRSPDSRTGGNPVRSTKFTGIFIPVLSQ